MIKVLIFYQFTGKEKDINPPFPEDVMREGVAEIPGSQGSILLAWDFWLLTITMSGEDAKGSG